MSEIKDNAARETIKITLLCADGLTRTVSLAASHDDCRQLLKSIDKGLHVIAAEWAGEDGIPIRAIGPLLGC